MKFFIYLSESTVVLSIIIGIAMVVLPYIGPWGNLSFHFEFPLNLTSTNTKVENMLKANDIWKKNQE